MTDRTTGSKELGILLTIHMDPEPDSKEVADAMDKVQNVYKIFRGFIFP